MSRPKPAMEDVSKRLRYITEESRRMAASFDAGQYDDAAVHMVNVRAAATMAKQDMWDFLGKTE